MIVLANNTRLIIFGFVVAALVANAVEAFLIVWLARGSFAFLYALGVRRPRSLLAVFLARFGVEALIRRCHGFWSTSFERHDTQVLTR